MPDLRWLHFTDLHVGMDDRGLWSKAEKDLHGDLKRLTRQRGPWDVVLFTGDLAWPRTFDPGVHAAKEPAWREKPWQKNDAGTEPRRTRVGEIAAICETLTWSALSAVADPWTDPLHAHRLLDRAEDYTRPGVLARGEVLAALVAPLVREALRAIAKLSLEPSTHIDRITGSLSYDHAG